MKFFIASNAEFIFLNSNERDLVDLFKLCFGCLDGFLNADAGETNIPRVRPQILPKVRVFLHFLAKRCRKSKPQTE